MPKSDIKLADVTAPLIRDGREYVYISEVPIQCQGHRYRVIRSTVLNVPVYSKLVLVEALCGPDIRGCGSSVQYQAKRIG